MTEERIQGVEQEVREGFRSMKESFGLVLEVLKVVKNIDEKMGDIKASTASAREVAHMGVAGHTAIFGY